jgi:YesN/AraC family two-component response regulator
MLQQVTSELLEEILRTVREQKARKEDKLVLMVADYLKAHFREELSLNGVAEHFRMSPYHLSKMFPKTMGASFVEYLTNLSGMCENDVDDRDIFHHRCCIFCWISGQWVF